jgi:serine O-acetyltransferase
MLRNYSCEISPYAHIGKRLLIHHSTGIVVGHEVIIGDDCEIFQNVTIGSNRKEKNGRMMPTIGNHVSIGSGAVVVGAIRIGYHVTIGANTYVDKDIPDYATVIGASMRIINR